ncbi:hydrolase [Fulvivirga imtechensis AK7]|uniref:Hydrolase n=1 Tax=Fulvivirga imtechensis AK7 TaxID=1237149 RepID=L8JLP1_9BACT|nr:alpha/beta fold hydrolase [Fulvivirga imtechensis]ELR68434.1 hydrolase [Fulvivirga imtechensis AK7]
MKISSLFWLIPVLLLINCKQPENVSQDEEGFLTINGSEVFYKTMGSGEPMIVIHGGPVLDHSYFLPHFETLAQNHRLIFYDQRACGRSSLEIDSATMSIAGFTDDIEQLRKALNLEKVDILGHSWGGLLAMHYAINYPENIDHLILSNSMPASTDGWQQEEAQLAARITREDSLERANIMASEEMQQRKASAIKKLMMLSFKTQFHDKSKLDSLNIYIPDDFMQRSAKFSHLGKDLMSFNLYDDLRQLNMSTLIIYGKDEPAASLSGKELEKIIPGSKLVVIENSGHFPFVEQPEAYFGQINSFVK